MPNMLNAAQTAEFNQKGFTYARGLFAPDEVKLLTDAMEQDPRCAPASSTGATARAARRASRCGTAPATASMAWRRAASAWSTPRPHCWAATSITTSRSSRPRSRRSAAPGNGTRITATGTTTAACGPTCCRSWSRSTGPTREQWLPADRHRLASSSAASTTRRCRRPRTRSTPSACRYILEQCPIEYCELEAGDALIFHCNAIHRSDANRSANRRWTLLICYNRVDNDTIIKADDRYFVPLDNGRRRRHAPRRPALRPRRQPGALRVAALRAGSAQGVLTATARF